MYVCVFSSLINEVVIDPNDFQKVVPYVVPYVQQHGPYEGHGVANVVGGALLELLNSHIELHFLANL